MTGLTTHTPAGPVELVLPGGLGLAQRTDSGTVVYPDAGAGFDFLAENTATGTRTVARIPYAGGPRVVTTFVRTPADTVMLAHTNGYLTLNRATPTAETIGMFSPAETRDATGKLVPSSYVVRQLRPQLYQLSEVIDPPPDTRWPVYVDPPLHVGGPGGAPLPAFSFSDVTGAISGAANAVTDAAATAASATVSGAKAVGTFVKNNPLESAMLVTGAALAVTGVGGPAGAAMIATATVNIASAGVGIAAAAIPDNQTLANASMILGAASMATPQGAAKKAVKEVAEEAAEQIAKHTTQAIDVAKTAPTPPAQLADEVTAAAGTKPPVDPGVSPKAPNAPPGTAKDIPERYVIPGGEHSWALPPAAQDARLSTDISGRVPLRAQTKSDVEGAALKDPGTGLPLDPNTFQPISGKPDFGHKPGYEARTSKEMAEKYGLSRRERIEWENDASHYQLEHPASNRSHGFEQTRSSEEMYGEYRGWLRKQMDAGNKTLMRDPTAQRRLSESETTSGRNGQRSSSVNSGDRNASRSSKKTNRNNARKSSKTKKTKKSKNRKKQQQRKNKQKKSGGR